MAAEANKPSAVATVAITVIVAVVGGVIVAVAAMAAGRDKDAGGGTAAEEAGVAEGVKIATGLGGRRASTSGCNVNRLVSTL